MHPFNQAMLSHLGRQLGEPAPQCDNETLATQSVDYVAAAGTLVSTGLHKANDGLRTLFSWNPDAS